MKFVHATVLALAVALVALLPQAASAQSDRPEGAVVSDIQVAGNLRVEPAAVLARLGFGPGDFITPRLLGDSIRSVYALGLFEDIQIDATEGPEGLLLTVVVSEKPAVSEVRFEGNDALKDDELLEEISVETGAILDENVMRAGAEAILEAYREKGFYLASVEPRVVPDGAGEVAIEYVIEEEEKVQVARVNIVGNETIEDRDITRNMMTRAGGFTSFVTRTGKFQREAFQADLQRIRLIYYESGYLDVAVGDPVVEIGPDRRRIYITIPVTEGDSYSVSDVSIGGDLLAPADEMMEDYINLTPGETFSSSDVRGDIERLTDVYKDAGYANANVNLLTRQDPDLDTVGVQYDIDRGEICYIGRITFIGNTLTRDRVMRRELALVEGQQYSITGLRRSEAYLKRLGFFEEVTYRERPSADNPRVIDIQFEVIERPTRSFNIGAGFSSVDSFIATAQISENNLFGRGQSVTLNAMFSALRTNFVLSFLEPHIAGSAVQLGVDLFIQQYVLPEFERDSRGASLTLGYQPFEDHQFWRDLVLRVGYKIEDVRLQEGRNGRDNFALLRRYDGGLTSSVTSGVTIDRRDDRVFTTRGTYLALDGELAESVIGSENEFYRLRGIGRAYGRTNFFECGEGDGPSRSFGDRMCNWADNWVGRVNAEIGYVGPTNPNRDVPIFERFYVGGPTSVRGFERLSLSPTEPAGRALDPGSDLRELVVGGFKQLIVNVELEFPLVSSFGLRGVAFFDAGNAFDRNEPYTLNLDLWNGAEANSLRTAIGWGFRWRSPIGPLRFEWGYPLVRQPNERRVVFEFSITPSF